MRRSAFLTLPIVVAALAVPVQAGGPPNILLIVADDLGYGELGCQGNPQVPTPNLDSLASNGVRFTSGYVTAPYCAPSRAGLMTGRYQARFGYDINPVGRRNLDPHAGLPTNERTMANLLKEARYVTGLVGKWHLGGTREYHPLRRGFDEFYGFLHEGHFYAPPERSGVTSFLRTNSLPPGSGVRRTVGNIVWSTHMGHNEPSYDADNPILHGTLPVTEGAFLTDAWAREGCAFIRRHRVRPWFLFLAHNAPHSPMQAQAEYLARFAHIANVHRRLFAAMVAHLDDSVGRVLAVLRELGLEDRTLIVFLSDNGGPTRELTSSNAPLSGGKGTLLEGGIRIPFMMQWKGRLPAGRIYREPVISLDILPTVLAAAAVPLPTGVAFDGVNLLPFLTGEESGAPHDVLFWRYGRSFALRQGNWKLLRQQGAAGFRLFDLSNDIAEANDLATARPDRCQALRQTLDEWNARMSPPLVLKRF